MFDKIEALRKAESERDYWRDLYFRAAETNEDLGGHIKNLEYERRTLEFKVEDLTREVNKLRGA